jgi:hypothetical protein
VKFAWTHARALLLGVALIVITNAVVLAGVAYNRSGEPESTLRLTERELNVRNWSWPANENSSIDLNLNWRIAGVHADDEGHYDTWYQGLGWLTPAQLQELGFDVEGDIESEEGAERLRRQPSKRAWVVLENDGPAYQAAVQRARERLQRATELAAANAGDEEFQQRLTAARRTVEGEETSATRLFVVDAGPEADALRARYPDRQRYAIVKGRINLAVVGNPGRKRLLGMLAETDVTVVRVPHAYRALVEPYTRSQQYSSDHAPRFSATVNFGRRFEPWIVALDLLD